MEAKKLVLLIIIQGMINAAAFATEEDSTSSRSAFFKTRENKRLKGHVIKRFKSPSLMSCSHSCLKNAWCTSTNFKMPSEKNGKGTCELNKHGVIDANTKFHDQQGVAFSVLLKQIFKGDVRCQSPCPDNKTCFPDGAAGYSCFCTDPGFQGERCDEDINECSTDAHGCSENAQCTNNVGSFTCSCKDGFEGNGKTCQDINECETGSNNCHENATCTNTEGSYKCTCNDDVIGDGVLCLGFPFHWTLNGSDPLVSLYNGSSYNTTDGRTVLYLDGDQRSYAETQAIPIQKISFSLLCWVKVLSLPGHAVHIYSDWSSPFQFRLYIDKPQLCVTLRRGSPYSQNKNIVIFCAGDITIGEWMHVAATWSRENRVGKLYLNGTKTDEQAGPPPPSSIDLNPTGHTVFDIGLKRDSGSTLHGYLRDLMVIDRAITEEELKSIFDWSK